MRILLAPVPPGTPAVGQPVGYVDPKPAGVAALKRKPAPVEGGEVLSYDGKQAYVGGRPVEHAQIAEPLAEEIARVAQRVFGPDFVGPMALASGLSLRTLARGRILTHGLPAPLLDMLGRASATEHPRATGYMLQAVAYLWDQHVAEFGIGEPGPGPGPMSAEGRQVLAERLDGILDRALGLVATMQGEAAAAKARVQARVTES